MKPITNIILALPLALATVTRDFVPFWYNFDGMQKMTSDFTCEPWFLHYTLGHDGMELRGRFEVFGCLQDVVKIGDNIFTLALNTSSNIATITYDRDTSLKTDGGVGSFNKSVDASGTIFTCFYGEGPSTDYNVSVPDC